MKKVFYILCVSAIAFTTSVTAKSPPAQGEAMVSKSTKCSEVSDLPLVSAMTLRVEMMNADMDTVHYAVIAVAPYDHIAVTTSVSYTAPFVMRPHGFLARNSC